MIFSKPIFAAELWESLRRNALKFQGMPDWVSCVLVMPFNEARHLPTYLSTARTSRPKIRIYETANLASFLEKCQYAWGQDEKRMLKLQALKEENFTHVIELEIMKKDGLCRIYFIQESHEPIHVELLPANFVRIPRWQELLSAWRGVLTTAVVLGLITCASAVTLKAMVIIYVASLLFYLLSLFAFGASHVFESALIVCLFALIAGLGQRANFHAQEKIKEIEHQKQIYENTHQE